MLSWTRLNQTVRIVPVNKMFYGQYLNKIVVYCPAARTILADNETELAAILQRRISDRLLYNWGGSWSNNYQSEILQKHSNFEQLKYFHNLKKNRKSKNISFRLEEPYISIYGNEEQVLYNVIENSSMPDRLTEVHRPESLKAQHLLLKGEVISRVISANFLNYNYKIYLRSYRFENEQHKKLLEDKFNDLQQNVRVPNKIRNFLQSDKLFFSGGYFYCTDELTITFIKLAVPELISSIFKLGRLSS